MCHEAGQSAFLHAHLYLSTNVNHILFSNVFGTDSLSMLMCRKAVNQSINQSILIAHSKHSCPENLRTIQLCSWYVPGVFLWPLYASCRTCQATLCTPWSPSSLFRLQNRRHLAVAAFALLRWLSGTVCQLYLLDINIDRKQFASGLKTWLFGCAYT